MSVETNLEYLSVPESPPSVLPRERSRLLPRISFRFVLLVVTATALAAYILRLAWDGSPLATALMYSLATVVICFAAFGLLFLIAWIPAAIGRDGLEDVIRGNPFSIDQLPPQLLPPREPGT